MLLDHVNLNHFRVFESVYRNKSMTLAAQQLHLTQSGVSQHIRSLEDMVGVTLFDRVQKRLVPTSAAHALFEHCAQGLESLELGLRQLKGQGKELRGTITLGTPIEFGNNLIVPLLSKFSRRHPLIKFRLKLGFASAMNDELVKGTMDFAFIDDFGMDKRVNVERVYDEELDLYISDALARKMGTPRLQSSFFESLPYVEYAENEPLLRMWFAHHLGAKEARNIRLNVIATVMDVQGVARFIASDAGAGVLPRYLVSKLTREGSSLYRFKGCGKPLMNHISVATLRDRTQSPATDALLEFLKGPGVI